MKKKVLYVAAALLAVCIAGAGGISAFGEAAKNTAPAAVVNAVISDHANEAVQEAEEEGKDVVVVDFDLTGSFKNEADGDGYKIYEDGTFTAYRDFENKKGKMIGTVLPDGDKWVFTSPGLDKGQVYGTYKDDEWIIDGKQYPYTFASVEMVPLHFRGLYANNKSLLIWGKKMENLEKEGLKCTADLDQKIPSLKVTDEIEISFKRGKAKVRAINPYENEASLSDCIICSFYTEDTTGTFTFESDGVACGDDCFDKLLENDVYKYEKDRLVYKEFLLTLSDFDFVSGEDPRGKKLLEADGDCDLTFCFDGSVLKSFAYTSPRLLYSGLDSNVDEEELQNMDEEKMGAALEVRGNILTSLGKAFKDAGIEAEIDETTGEIAMDSKVLFAVNSYELSDEGKAYLDQFMKAYVPVLFSDEFKDSIAHVDFEGHTDSVGSFGFNMELSQNRADAVRDYCLESTENGLDENQKALLREKAVTRGFASTDLVYDENGTEDGDASRRVLVKFFITVK
jgi:outer membrane protein OmpA-like peptidoglycan-associated protein